MKAFWMIIYVIVCTICFPIHFISAILSIITEYTRKFIVSIEDIIKE